MSPPASEAPFLRFFASNAPMAENALFCDLPELFDQSMSPTPKPDWDAVRADYAQPQMRVAVILEKHGISQRQFYVQRQKLGWPLRNPRSGVGRDDLVSRLFGLLERQIARLERDMPESTDKEVAILGNLTRNLEKLVELDKKQKDQSADAQSRADIDHLRQRLSRRIGQLRQK